MCRVSRGLAIFFTVPAEAVRLMQDSRLGLTAMAIVVPLAGSIPASCAAGACVKGGQPSSAASAGNLAPKSAWIADHCVPTFTYAVRLPWN